MYNSLVEQISIIHADYKLRFRADFQTPDPVFFIDKQVGNLNIDAFPLLLGNEINFL